MKRGRSSLTQNLYLRPSFLVRTRLMIWKHQLRCKSSQYVIYPITISLFNFLVKVQYFIPFSPPHSDHLWPSIRLLLWEQQLFWGFWRGWLFLFLPPYYLRFMKMILFCMWSFVHFIMLFVPCVLISAYRYEAWYMGWPQSTLLLVT